MKTELIKRILEKSIPPITQRQEELAAPLLPQDVTAIVLAVAKDMRTPMNKADEAQLRFEAVRWYQAARIL